MSNPFFMDDSKEVDDDAFLNHPRSGSSGYMLQNSRQAASTPGYNQFSSSDRQRNALGLDSEGNKEYGMDRVQVRIIKCKFIRKISLYHILSYSLFLTVLNHFRL